MKLLNLATPEQVARFKAQYGYDAQPKRSKRKRPAHASLVAPTASAKPKKMKALPPPKCPVDTSVTWVGDDFVSVMCGVEIHSPNKKLHWSILSAGRDASMLIMQSQLRALTEDQTRRDDIIDITLIRISPDPLDHDDNLRTSFKHIRDAVATWVLLGRWPTKNGIENKRGIGHSDGRLEKRGMKWHWEQRTSQRNPQETGIEIRLQLKLR